MSRLKIAIENEAVQTVERLYKDLERRIVASPPGICPVDLALNFLRLCHAQTCGKCVPCRIGLGQLATYLEDVLDGRATMATLGEIERLAKDIEISADCAIGTEAARMVLRGLDGFRDEYVAHIQTGNCTYPINQPVPCVALCPAGVDIPGYIALIREGRCADAVRLIRKDNPFPTACALICEHPCEARCRRNMLDSSVNIRGLKRYAVDNAGVVPAPVCGPSTGKRVAIVGGGPSGLSAAYYLQLMGHSCTVFELRPKLGGMLRYGIPNYRFPRERLQEDIDCILPRALKSNTTPKSGKASRLTICAGNTTRCMSPLARRATKRWGSREKRARTSIRRSICSAPSAATIRRISRANAWLSSAAATWRWTACVRRSDWARAKPRSFTAAAKRI